MKNLLDEISTQFPGKIAVSEGNYSFSYVEFSQRVLEIANFIKNRKLDKNSRIGLLPMSSCGSLLSYYACELAGHTGVPVPFKDEERINGAVQQANISFFLEDPVGGSLGGSYASVEYTGGNKDNLSDSEALVLFTSGTTSSKLKGVKLSTTGISSACLYMNELMEVEHTTIELVFAPLDHAFGFGRCHSVLAVGGSIVLSKNLKSLSSIFELVADYNCNAMSAPPSILSSILRLPSEDLHSLTTQVRQIQTGAMRFDPTFRKRLLDIFHNTRIFLHYGLSEAMRVTLFELNAAPEKIHTEGLPSKGMDLQIFDKNRHKLTKNCEGLIGFKGKNLCLGYLDDKFWQSQLYQGYFITSDRGQIDDDGYLIFLGRADDTINANGILVDPDEIEGKILKVLPQISFSVIGIKDPASIRDSIIVLCKEGTTELKIQDLRQLLKGIDAHLIPTVILEIDRLPRTRTGKVNRSELKKLAAEKLLVN